MAVAQDDRMRVHAQAKWVRTSARKARVVLDHIRGRSVPEARTILAFTPRAAATDIEKVLRSAVANAESNHGLDGDELPVAHRDVRDLEGHGRQPLTLHVRQDVEAAAGAHGHHRRVAAVGHGGVIGRRPGPGVHDDAADG